MADIQLIQCKNQQTTSSNRQKVDPRKEIGVKESTSGSKNRLGARSHLSPEILILHVWWVHDVITGNKFHQNRSRGFRATGVQKLGYPIDLACRPYNSSALPCWLWQETGSYTILADNSIFNRRTIQVVYWYGNLGHGFEICGENFPLRISHVLLRIRRYSGNALLICYAMGDSDYS